MRSLTHVLHVIKGIPFTFLIIAIILLTTNAPLLYANVTINEILPKTEDDSKQWIELYNTGNESVSLDRWRLENTTGETKSFLFNASSVIQGRSFLTFYQTQTGIILNKNGDTVRLIDEKNTVIDSQSYPGILGYYMTMGRTIDGEGVWSICTSATPNKINICPVPTSTPVPPTVIPTLVPTSEPTSIPTIMDTSIIFLSPTTSITTPLPLAGKEASPTGEVTSNQWKYIAIGGLLVGLVWIGFLVLIIMRQRKSLLTKPPSHHST